MKGKKREHIQTAIIDLICKLDCPSKELKMFWACWNSVLVDFNSLNWRKKLKIEPKKEKQTKEKHIERWNKKIIEKK